MRNLYRPLEEDGEWTPLEIAVRGKNISVKVKGEDVVCYTEPDQPWRLPQYGKMRLGHGAINVAGEKGKVSFRGLKIERLGADATNPCDTLPPIDESTDRAIQLQQEDFPVIDWHVHLKGGLTAEMAHAMSMNYGINYGVAPNAGEGGVGRMLADDAEVYAYHDEISGEPFLFGVQGEGRRWTATFSQEALGIFEYLFTDAMLHDWWTAADAKGFEKRAKLYSDFFDGIGAEAYMDHLVDQTVLILTNEPADIYANPTFLPDALQGDYDRLWTTERVDRVLDVLEKKYPHSSIVLTLGKDGAWAMTRNERFFQPAYKVKAVDTTAAGDTFTGYFLAGISSGMPIPDALRRAAFASSIAVSRKGAADSIPTVEEVNRAE